MRLTIFDIMDFIYPGIAIYKFFDMSYEEALKSYLEKKEEKEKKENNVNR